MKANHSVVQVFLAAVIAMWYCTSQWNLLNQQVDTAVVTYQFNPLCSDDDDGFNRNSNHLDSNLTQNSTASNSIYDVWSAENTTATLLKLMECPKFTNPQNPNLVDQTDAHGCQSITASNPVLWVFSLIAGVVMLLFGFFFVVDLNRCHNRTAETSQTNLLDSAVIDDKIRMDGHFNRMLRCFILFAIIANLSTYLVWNSMPPVLHCSPLPKNLNDIPIDYFDNLVSGCVRRFDSKDPKQAEKLKWMHQLVESGQCDNLDCTDCHFGDDNRSNATSNVVGGNATTDDSNIIEKYKGETFHIGLLATEAVKREEKRTLTIFTFYFVAIQFAVAVLSLMQCSIKCRILQQERERNLAALNSLDAAFAPNQNSYGSRNSDNSDDGNHNGNNQAWQPLPHSAA